MQGTFYDSQTKNRAAFHCVKAGLKDCPHISPDKVQRIIAKYGENDPFTRSCVYGEFMEQDDETQFCISHSTIHNALSNPPPHRPGLKIGFIDFAESSAEYVLAARDGNKTIIALAFHESNKHAACSRLIRGCIQAGFKPEQVWGDANDKEAADIMASMNWRINRQNFGAPARNKEMFHSWSAEAWIDTGIGMSKGDLIVPNDDILIAQLTSRKKEIVGRGKWAAEEKYDMRKRGIESIDRADAYCGANNVYDHTVFDKVMNMDDWREMSESQENVRELAAMGAAW